jgi:RNA recognition motif-containing protein
MLKKIYVGNLPFDITEKQVRELFAPYGDVFVVDMVIDFETNQFRGFGFVEMEEEAADAAIAGLKGHKIEGRNLKISEARSDKAAPGNHPGSNLHMRTSRGQFGGAKEFGPNGREAGNVRGSITNHGQQKSGGAKNTRPKGKGKSKGGKKRSRSR